MEELDPRKSIHKMVDMLKEKDLEAAAKYLLFLIVQSSGSNSIIESELDFIFGRVESHESAEALVSYLKKL